MIDKIRKHFIDWDQLPLSATASWLAGQFADDGTLDMSAALLVMPTSSAAYRLLELLVEIAGQRGLALTPPAATTIGNVPEMLYQPSRPLASPLTQSLAWVEALQQSPVEELRQFTRLIPEADDFTSWRTLGTLLASWHRELASHGLTFPDVLNAGEQVEVFEEHSRWQALGNVQRRYLDVLHRSGLWDQQSARLVAIEQSECCTDKQLFLIGLVDLDPVFRKMLDQVADRVTAVVFSASNQRDWFDDCGCLDHDRWREVSLEIADSQILVANQPTDMAQMVVAELARLDGQYAIHQVGIAVPDSQLIPPLMRSLMRHQIQSFDSGGSSISHARPFVLLELVTEWLQSHTFESFAKLVRHPDIYDWLVAQTGNDGWLLELDTYQNSRLPFFFSPGKNQHWFGDTDRHGQRIFANLERAFDEMLGLVEAFCHGERGNGENPDDGQPPLRPPGEWAQPWRQLLNRVYEKTGIDSTRDADRRLVRACQALVSSLIEMEQAGQVTMRGMTGSEAIQWAMASCSNEFVVDSADPDAIPLSGWLEAPWQETSVSLVTSVNEGLIPSSESASVFIPNSIRSRLGLTDNQRRYSRDAWSLGLILNSRQITRLFVLRRGDEGDPKLPSRLLLTGDPQKVAKRARDLFGDGDSVRGTGFAWQAERPDRQQLVIPVPSAGEPPIDSMRVTDFGVYLKCPYRFYLSRVLGLERRTDTAEEMDAARFGSLLHDVVENFGRSEIRNSADFEQIRAHVEDCLDRFGRARFGRYPMPAVTLQLEQARLRLKAFAEWQAGHRSEGYEIFAVEREKTRHVFDLDGKPFEIRGQIDRIDINHSRRTIGVFDYKTNDRRKGPREYHQSGGEWTDLQLPLYEFLLGEFDLPAEYTIEFGLILLARDTNKIFLETADWTRAELLEAHQLALDIMRSVRRGEFWPPNDRNVPGYFDDFAAICQTSVFQRWAGVADRDTEMIRRPLFAVDGDADPRDSGSFRGSQRSDP